MTGSSSRKLKKEGVDLLGGRALRKEMHPFMCAEIPEQVSLDQLIQFGLLPLVFSAESKQKPGILDAYVSLYMEQEVYQESLVRNIADFSRFLEIVSLSHGSILNITNVARDSGVNRKTVESYLQILEDILLAGRIPVFSKKASRDTTQHPKFYLFDSGVFNAIRPRGPMDNPAEIAGAALEGLVAQHLKAWIAYTNGKHKLYFWRTRYHHEVDFILYGDIGLFAIEVKSSTILRTDDLKGLIAFSEEYPLAECMILYRGKETLLKGKIWAVPVELFLHKLRPQLSPFYFL